MAKWLKGVFSPATAAMDVVVDEVDRVGGLDKLDTFDKLRTLNRLATRERLSPIMLEVEVDRVDKLDTFDKLRTPSQLATVDRLSPMMLEMRSKRSSAQLYKLSCSPQLAWSCLREESHVPFVRHLSQVLLRQCPRRFHHMIALNITARSRLIDMNQCRYTQD